MKTKIILTILLAAALGFWGFLYAEDQWHEQVVSLESTTPGYEGDALLPKVKMLLSENEKTEEFKNINLRLTARPVAVSDAVVSGIADAIGGNEEHVMFDQCPPGDGYPEENPPFFVFGVSDKSNNSPNRAFSLSGDNHAPNIFGFNSPGVSLITDRSIFTLNESRSYASETNASNPWLNAAPLSASVKSMANQAQEQTLLNSTLTSEKASINREVFMQKSQELGAQ